MERHINFFSEILDRVALFKQLAVVDHRHSSRLLLDESLGKLRAKRISRAVEWATWRVWLLLSSWFFSYPFILLPMFLNRLQVTYRVVPPHCTGLLGYLADHLDRFKNGETGPPFLLILRGRVAIIMRWSFRYYVIWSQSSWDFKAVHILVNCWYLWLIFILFEFLSDRILLDWIDQTFTRSIVHFLEEKVWHRVNRLRW